MFMELSTVVELVMFITVIVLVLVAKDIIFVRITTFEIELRNSNIINGKYS